MEDIVDTSVALTHAPLPPTSSAAQPQPPRPSTPPPQDMFAGTFYFIAPSLPVGRRAGVEALLREYGGEEVDVGDERLTTVIAPHGATRWEGWEIVAEREQEGGQVDVVTDVWVERSVLLGKVQSPQHYSIEPALIFSGIIACAATADFSVSDLEVLAAGISALGGQWRTALTREVTHLFALKSGTPKYETAVHFQAETGVTILVPHWFDDSVRLGGGLPTAEYEWPEPRVLHRGVAASAGEGGGRKDKDKDKGGDRDASNDTALSALTPPLAEEEQMRRNVFTSSAYTPAARARSSVENGTLELGVAGINPYTRLSPGGTALELPSPRTSPYPLSQPLKGKRILISRNLGLSGGRLGALHAQITRAGGTIVRFAGDDDEHESEEPAEDGGGGGGWTVSATFRPGERGYKPLLAYPHPAGHHTPDRPITRVLGRLPPAERARRRAELAAVDACDVLITRWRWGAAYVRAVRERRTVATLAWLFFLLMPVHAPAAGAVASARPAPTEQLLHYPVPKGPVEGFEKHVVTVTNYTGEAREYLKKLITGMGGVFTPSMSGQNTVLIAAYVRGTKAEKARAWSIPVVNHTWLEDCFAQWRNLTVALEKYVVFPPGVDFSALLGSRGVFVGAGKHPVPGLGLAPGLMSAGAAEQQEAELGRLEAEAEELLEDYDELAEEWEDEQRVERRRNEDGAEEWVPVSHAAEAEEEEGESQLVQPSGTEAAEIKEVVDDLIEVRDDDDGDMVDNVDAHRSPARPKARANGPSQHSPTKPAVSATKQASKAKEAAKRKTKAAVVDADVLDFNSSSSSEEVQVAKPVKKGPPVSAKKSATPKKPAKRVLSDVDEEAAKQAKRVEADDSDVEVVPAKKPAAPKASSSAKPLSKSKKKALVSSDEEDAEEQAAEAAHEDEDVMEVDTPKPRAKKSASKPAKSTAVAKSKPPVVEEQEDESVPEDSLVRTPKPNGKATATAQPAAAGPSRKAAEKADKSPAFPSSSLLARPKADARTRVVRRGPKDPAAEAGADEAKPSKKKKIMVEESEDSEEIVVSRPNGKAKEPAAAKKGGAQKSTSRDTKKPAPKGKGRARVVDTPESEDEEEEDDDEQPPVVDSEPEPESDPAPPRRKLARRVKAERPTTTAKPVSKSAATAHGKRIPDAADEDSDDSLPEASHILSRLEKRVADAAPKPKSKGNAKGPTEKAKVSAATKAVRQPAESEEEEEDDEPTVVTVKPKSKPIAKAAAPTHTKNAVAGPSAPKRTVSVLTPSLNLSGKPKSVAVKEASKPKPASKAKKPVSEEPENEEQEEDEVANITSSKLTRTGSLRVASGHVSTPSSSAIPKKPHKQEKARSKRTADEALSSDEEDARRMPPPPQALRSTDAGPPPRRTAAAKASERLHNQIMPDVIAFEGQKRRAAEQARKGRVSMDAFKVAGEGSLEELRVQPGSSQSQSRNGKRASQGDECDEDEEEEEEKRPTKKKRRISDEVEVVITRKGKAKAEVPVEVDKEPLSKPSIQIMTTQVNLSDDVLRALLKLGIKMTSRAVDCTHLIAKQVVRTEKFLCALTRAPWVVTEAWALNCVAHKKVLPEKDYLLKDKAGEDKYCVRLADALRRAEKLKGSLFKGHTFYVTNRVPVDLKLLKNVVNACGGQISTQTPTMRIINAAPDTRHVISCTEDASIWRPLAMAHIKVYTQELLLNGALRQQVDYDSDEFLLKT